MKLQTFTPKAKKAFKKNTGEKKEWELVPEGEYATTLVSFDDVKNDKGGYVRCRFEVSKDNGGKMLVFQNFFTGEKYSAEAREIAIRQLGHLAKATIGDELSDTAELENVVGKTFISKVIIRKPKDPKYGAQNEIVRYLKA